MINPLKITIVSDGSDTLAQSHELALRLTSPENIFKIYKDDEPKAEFIADLAIGVGFYVTEILVKIKETSGGKTKIAIILDPLSDYEKFDFIILPSYEPYNVKGNVLRTTGLVNFVNENYLISQKNEFENHIKYKFLRELIKDKKLPQPYLSVLIGGRHTSGNIDAEDTKIIANKINEIVSKTSGSALITTSRRTELAVSEILRQQLKIPYFLYDYKIRETENPYGVFLSLAEEIIVTGESVRMMSECCSTGKAVRIYRPRQYGFQYKPLITELITIGCANEFATIASDMKRNKLDETGRIAGIIRNNL